MVGLEPSCTAVFRADAPELMPDDEDVKRLSRQFLTFSEQLLRRAPEKWQPPVLSRAATVQTHCHQHAVTKFDADRELMRRAGIDADVLDQGCCGFAGNFGFEAKRHELSMKIAESGVLPAVRRAAPSALVIADGFSCRTQVEQGDTGRRALHLAEVLALGLAGSPPRPSSREGRRSPRFAVHSRQLGRHRRGRRCSARRDERLRPRDGPPAAPVRGRRASLPEANPYRTSNRVRRKGAFHVDQGFRLHPAATA